MMKYVYLTGLLLTLFSCSDYNKVLKSDDYERKFELANGYYENPAKSSQGKAIGLYEQIYQRFARSGKGELAYYRIGKAYYNTEDYHMAGYYLGNFPQRFPASVKCEEALFLSALCSVNNSPETTLDQTETEVAIHNLQQFLNRYPESELIDSCNNIIDKLRFKLETKRFNAIKLYNHTENYRSAVTTAVDFLADNPVSQYREKVSYFLVRNSYYLAKNSVESKKEDRINKTLERYQQFLIKFPDSKDLKELTFLSKKAENLRE